MDPRNNRIQPFRLVGNLYFVGGRAVSVYAIDTGDGILMIDTGYPFMKEEVLSNMREVGLDPADVRKILLTHGHYDHVGNAAAYRALTGAKLYGSRIDNEILNGHLDISWAEECGAEPLPPFDCDVLLEDGDVVSLGDTAIRCVIAPGHTLGTLALFLNVMEGDRAYACALHGGTGMGSMAIEYLRSHNLSPDCRDRFRESLHELREIPVDIVLGGHPEQSDTEGKLARLLAGEENPFYDPGEWRRFLNQCESNLDAMLSDERQRGLIP